MIEYVCGFMFAGTEYVALIRKARPAWQRGLLNGIGGKIEPGETPRQAMRREFEEETGFATLESDWGLRVIHGGSDHRVFFFAAKRPERFAIRCDGDEPCSWVEHGRLREVATVPNLRWLVPISLDPDLQFPVEVYDHSDPEQNGASVINYGDRT